MTVLRPALLTWTLRRVEWLCGEGSAGEGDKGDKVR